MSATSMDWTGTRWGRCWVARGSPTSPWYEDIALERSGEDGPIPYGLFLVTAQL